MTFLSRFRKPKDDVGHLKAQESSTKESILLHTKDEQEKETYKGENSHKVIVFFNAVPKSKTKHRFKYTNLSFAKQNKDNTQLGELLEIKFDFH